MRKRKIDDEVEEAFFPIKPTIKEEEWEEKAKPLWSNGPPTRPSARSAGIEKHTQRRRDNRIRFEWDESEDTSRLSPMSTVMMPSTSTRKDPLASTERHHWSERPLSRMTSRDWRILREDFGIVITCSGSNSAHSAPSMPNAIRRWSECSDMLHPLLLQSLQRRGYREPRPIQRQAIPTALTGVDFIGLAETGSGKTAAYLLPMLHAVLTAGRLEQRQRDSTQYFGPLGIVLAPTRELALQIEQECRLLLPDQHMKVVTLIGGHSLTEQSLQLRNGADVVIATPGRLRDCLEQRVLSLGTCRSLVWDEADRMIDMNFEDDMDAILAHKDATACQTSMFSATMLPAIERLASKRLRSPFLVIRIGDTGSVVDTVRQQLVWCADDARKSHMLAEVLGYCDEVDGERFKAPIIVFVNQRARVETVARRLEALGWPCATLYGDKSQQQREQAIDAVRRGHAKVLVATDVAGRGIDIPNVSLVLNYDLPRAISDYVHRLGRTGRAGTSGHAISFVSGDDAPLFFELRRTIMRSNNHDPFPPEFANHEATMQRHNVQSSSSSHPQPSNQFGQMRKQ